ncbi:hypothetical protein HZ326_14240 [Fusarium oxysporum f. sp. albedinis]|nr:hypothetical protein HZ326_14240 [Fusarium oxysporum f. sp. albedinis]
MKPLQAHPGSVWVEAAPGVNDEPRSQDRGSCSRNRPSQDQKPSQAPSQQGARVQNQVLAVNPKNDGGSFESNSQRQKRCQLTCDMTACLPEPKHLVTVYQCVLDYHVFLAISGIDSVNQINFGYPYAHLKHQRQGTLGKANSQQFKGRDPKRPA